MTDFDARPFHECLKAAGGSARVRQSGPDVVIEDIDSIEIIEAARALAEVFGDRIDIRSTDYEELEGMIEDWGCDSCGHGSVLILRGGATPEGETS